MTWIALGVMSMVAVLGWVAFFLERRKNEAPMHIKPWLEVQRDLNKAGQSIIHVTRLDPDDIFYRGPH